MPSVIFNPQKLYAQNRLPTLKTSRYKFETDTFLFVICQIQPKILDYKAGCWVCLITSKLSTILLNVNGFCQLIRLFRVNAEVTELTKCSRSTSLCMDVYLFKRITSGFVKVVNQKICCCTFRRMLTYMIAKRQATMFNIFDLRTVFSFHFDINSSDKISGDIQFCFNIIKIVRGAVF